MPVPPAAPAIPPIAAPLPPPATAPIRAPTPAPPPAIKMFRFLWDLPEMPQVSVETETGWPPVGVIDVSIREISAGRLRRPELTTLATRPPTELPVGATVTPLTASGAANVPLKALPASVEPVFSPVESRT